ncbi:hypothetical protein [Larkinella sp.]|uniref:hypothetical protein n=1 Tax=Larkinella sp. TaxID=2034517 RepID=UPI003BAAD4DD
MLAIGMYFNKIRCFKLLRKIVRIHPDVGTMDARSAIDTFLDREAAAMRKRQPGPAAAAGYPDLYNKVIRYVADHRATFLAEQYFLQRSIIQEQQALLDQASQHIASTQAQHKQAVDFAGKLVDEKVKTLPEFRTN